MPLAYLVSEYELTIHGVLHLGAHVGEEAEAYEAAGVDNVVWIEGNPDVLDELRANVEPRGHRVVHALLGPADGQPLTLNVTNNRQSSSVLPLGTHKRHHPQVEYTHEVELVSRTVDSIAEQLRLPPANFLNVDLQGAELLALSGAEETLARADYVYTEVNEEPVYDGCVLLPQLDSFLERFDMSRVETRLTAYGWGDALYVRAAERTGRVVRLPPDRPPSLLDRASQLGVAITRRLRSGRGGTPPYDADPPRPSR